MERCKSRFAEPMLEKQTLPGSWGGCSGPVVCYRGTRVPVRINLAGQPVSTLETSACECSKTQDRRSGVVWWQSEDYHLPRCLAAAQDVPSHVWASHESLLLPGPVTRQ